MFAFLRRIIMPIIIIALVGFVATIVLEWGLGLSSSQQADQANFAAVINGEEIPWDTWRRFYNVLYANAVGPDQEELPASRERELEDRAFDQMVQDQLLMQEVVKRGITATPDEVYSYLRLSPPDYVRSISAFQTDGQFDYQKYLGAMLQAGTEPFWRQIELLAQDDVRKLKLQQFIVENALVTEEEVRRRFIRDREKVEFGLVNVSYASQADPEPLISEEDARAYYDSHQDEFQVDERVSCRFAYLDKVASDADHEAANDLVVALHDSLEAGDDFATLAQTYSDDPSSASRGGDLGFFPRGAMVPEFDSLAFEMKDGELSKPFRTQFGWHIIKHHGYRTDTEVPRGGTEPADVRKAHVSHILISVNPSQETLDGLNLQMNTFVEKARETGFAEAASESGVLLDSMQALGRDYPMGKLGSTNPWANDFIFDNPEGTISEVRENDQIIYVIQPHDYRPTGIRPFDKAKVLAESKLKTEAILKRCEQKASEISAEARATGFLKPVAEKHGFEYQTFGPMTRDGYLQGIGKQAPLIGAAFAIPEVGGISPATPFQAGAGVIMLLDRQEPNLTEFTEKRDSLWMDVRSQKQQQLIRGWFTQVLDNADIVNNLQALREAQDESI